MSLLAHILMTSGIVIVLAMLALWLVGTMLRDVSIADPFWGAGFVIVAGVAWHMSSGAGLRVVLLAILSALWGLRLSLFLLWRKHGHAEDRR